MDYKKKYLLYKKKYIKLKNAYGGDFLTPKKPTPFNQIPDTPNTIIVKGIEEGLKLPNAFDDSIRFDNIWRFISKNSDKIREDRKLESKQLRKIVTIKRFVKEIRSYYLR